MKIIKKDQLDILCREDTESMQSYENAIIAYKHNSDIGVYDFFKSVSLAGDLSIAEVQHIAKKIKIAASNNANNIFIIKKKEIKNEFVH